WKQMSWKDLQLLIETDQISELGRSPVEEESYQQWKMEQAKIWKSMKDLILVEKFQYSRQLDNQTRQFYAVLHNKSYKENHQQNIYNYSLNNFPYHIAEDLTHYILWKVSFLNTKQNNDK